MSGTETPAPPQTPDERFAAALGAPVAEQPAPEGAPPAAERPAAAPSPAEGRAAVAGEQIEQPTEPAAPSPAPVDWETRFKQAEAERKKLESERQAAVGHAQAAQRAAQEAQRQAEAERQQRQQGELAMDARIEALRDQARSAGDPATAQQYQQALDQRRGERAQADRDRALAAREADLAAQGSTLQQRHQALAAEEQRLAREALPASMQGAIEPLITTLRAEGYDDIDAEALKAELTRLVQRPHFQNMARAITTPQEFLFLVGALEQEGRARAEGQRERRAEAARANRTRDAESGRYVAEGGGPGGEAPREIRIMDDVTADDWARALARG